MKGFAAYSPCGATSETCAVGESMETITNTAKNTKKVGFSSLPTHVKIFPGRSENQSAAAKNTKEKINSHVLALLSGVVSVLLAVALAKKVLPKPIGMLSLALLLGGAVGNFIDRLLFGFVTDMFATTFMNFPVFNVADIGVVVGGVLLCIHVIFTYSKEPKPEEKP